MQASQSIQMVDLKGQYIKIRKEIDEAISDVIASSAFVKSKFVRDFEENLQNYLNISHVIACGNGTDALQIALMALDLNEGDEILTTPFTFIATVEVIALLKLTPVFVDIDPYTYNLDTGEIESRITEKTKVILPVHLYGQSADMDAILSIAQKHGLTIVEDNAQAIGGDYRLHNEKWTKTGTIGHIGATSFFPSKNLGAYGDGGAIMTKDENLAHKIRAIANHGMIKKYYHDFIGVNSRLDGIQAAILNVKLKYLDAYINARQSAAAFYDAELSGLEDITIPGRSANSSHVFHQYTIALKNANRDDLQNYLRSKNIPSMIYYPIPLHLQKAFLHLGYKKGDSPITEDICQRVLSIPMHTELTTDQLRYITDTIKTFYS